MGRAALGGGEVLDGIGDVVFIPKSRKRALYGELRRRMGEMFRSLARQKECEVLEGRLMPDHVHMLISIPKYSVAQVMGTS